MADDTQSLSPLSRFESSHDPVKCPPLFYAVAVAATKTGCTNHKTVCGTHTFTPSPHLQDKCQVALADGEDAVIVHVRHSGVHGRAQGCIWDVRAVALTLVPPQAYKYSGTQKGQPVGLRFRGFDVLYLQPAGFAGSCGTAAMQSIIVAALWPQAEAACYYRYGCYRIGVAI